MGTLHHLPNAEPIKAGDIRYDEFGAIRCLAYAEGHLMIRRKGCAVASFVMKAAEWRALSKTPVK